MSAQKLLARSISRILGALAILSLTALVCLLLIGTDNQDDLIKDRQTVTDQKKAQFKSATAETFRHSQSSAIPIGGEAISASDWQTAVRMLSKATQPLWEKPPPHLVRLLSTNGRSGFLGFSANLSEQDQDYLESLFDKERSSMLKERIGLALGFYGDETSVPRLIQALVEDLPQNLGESEIRAMSSFVAALGYQAASNEMARGFLSEACDQGFWRKNRNSRNEVFAQGDTDRILAGTAMQALGASGWQDFPAYLYSMKNNVNQAREHAGDIASAAYFWERSQEFGRDSWRAWYLQPARGMEDFEVWSASPSGKAWLQWHKELLEAR